MSTPVSDPVSTSEKPFWLRPSDDGTTDEVVHCVVPARAPAVLEPFTHRKSSNVTSSRRPSAVPSVSVGRPAIPTVSAAGSLEGATVTKISIRSLSTFKSASSSVIVTVSPSL